MSEARFVKRRLARMGEAQRKALIQIAEEAGEVAHIALKTLRFGPTKYNPYSPELGCNIEMLADEAADLREALNGYVAVLRPAHAKRFARRAERRSRP